MWPWYMCILLYVKLIQYSGIPQIYGQLEEGALVYVHSAICETDLEQWYSIHLWSIGSALSICAWYSTDVYVEKEELYLGVVVLSYDLWSIGREGRSELIWCSGIPHIYDQLEEGDQLVRQVHSVHLKIIQCQWYSIDLMSIGRGLLAM